MATEGGPRREEDFLPDFQKYIERELNFSRLKNSNGYYDIRRWVFWNQEDHDLYRSDDPFIDIDACERVRLNIRNALHELTQLYELAGSLVQFWAPTKTREGQTLLKSQNEPFALSYHLTDDVRDNICKYWMEMCEEYPYFYADATCSEKQLGLPGRVFLHQYTVLNQPVRYYSEEEYPQLKLALRCGIYSSLALPVFEHSSHSCLGVLEVVFCSKETFDLSERISDINEHLIDNFCDIFKKFGLLCFDGSTQFHAPCMGQTEAFWDASDELKLLGESVCRIHSLPLALTWASCGSCSDVLQSLSSSVDGLRGCLGEENCDRERYCSFSNLKDFVEASELCLLKKGQFTGRILPFPNLLYCSDIRQYSIAEYPLVRSARKCEISGCFTMWLQSSYVGDELYVLELFFPASNINNENLLTTLRLILRTMEENFKTFKLASGQGFGEALSVEVINFQNGQRNHSIETIPATPYIPSLELLNDGEVPLQQGQELGEALSVGIIDFLNAQKSHCSTIIPTTRSIPSLELLKDEEITLHLGQLSMDPSNKGKNVVSVERNILLGSSSKEGKRNKQDRELRRVRRRIEVPLEEILKCSRMKHQDAARELNVTRYTFRRICARNGIERWPPCNKGKVHPSMPIIPENQGQSPQVNYYSDEDSCSVGNINQGFRDEDEMVNPFLSPLIENQGSSQQLNSALHPNEHSCNVSKVNPACQNVDMVTIKAKWEHYPTIKFRLPQTSGLGELRQEVHERLKLDAGSYDVKYEDENDLILIAVDEDLQEYIQSSISDQGNKTPVVVQLKRK